MPRDVFYPATIRDAQLSLGVAVTTSTCRRAQRAQELATTSAIALGRLMTAAVLSALVRERGGRLSLQVLCRGRLSQAFADIAPGGEARGFVKNTSIALPLFPDEELAGRRTIAPAVGEGVLSVIQEPLGREFTQSSTPLVSGELDRDVEHFLDASDQIPTVLTCDVLVDASGAIQAAGGIIAQAMPGADLERLAALRRTLARGRFARHLKEHAGDPQELLRALAKDAEPVAEVTPLRWRCRCSRQRVLGALALLGPEDLADMVEKNETAQVRCDFCRKEYAIGPDEVAKVYQKTVQGRH